VQRSDAAEVAGHFLDAFSAADFERMRALLAEDVVAYVTNAAGEMDEIEGREAYLGRLEAMDLPSARFSVEPTQAPRRGRTDHRVADGRRQAVGERRVLVVRSAVRPR
jgi:ketosteroid isomerase-like protein